MELPEVQNLCIATSTYNLAAYLNERIKKGELEGFLGYTNRETIISDTLKERVTKLEKGLSLRQVKGFKEVPALEGNFFVRDPAVKQLYWFMMNWGTGHDDDDSCYHSAFLFRLAKNTPLHEIDFPQGTHIPRIEPSQYIEVEMHMYTAEDGVRFTKTKGEGGIQDELFANLKSLMK